MLLLHGSFLLAKYVTLHYLSRSFVTFEPPYSLRVHHVLVFVRGYEKSCGPSFVCDICSYCLVLTIIVIKASFTPVLAPVITD